MAIGSGVLLPAVVENLTFPILSALAYTTGLGYRPTCDVHSTTLYMSTVEQLPHCYLFIVSLCGLLLRPRVRDFRDYICFVVTFRE